MSLNALELVLYDLGVKRDARKAFREDADALLSKYRLTSDEAQMVKRFDVLGMYRAGASPMLTMGFWQMCEESRSMSAYIKRMNGAQ